MARIKVTPRHQPYPSNRPICKTRGKCSIGKLPFKRLVEETAQNLNKNVRFGKQAVLELQDTAEAFLIELFKDAFLYATNASRSTLKLEDIHLELYARRMRGHRF